MSRTQRILGSASIAYVHQAAIVLVGLWLTPFVLRQIGEREYGLWLVAGQLLGYLTLLDLGVLAILPREIALAFGEQNKLAANERIAGLISQVHGIVRWQLPALAATCLAVWLWMPLEWAGLRWPLVPVFAAFLALYPLRVESAALQGVQDLVFMAKAQLAGWALGTLTTVLLVVADMRLQALALGWVVTLATPALAGWWRAHGRWPVMRSRKSARDFGPYFRRSIWVSMGQIAQVLLAGSDVLILGTMLGPAAVVAYACTGKLVTVFANHPQLLMHAAQPALTELRASDSRDRIRTAAAALTHAMLMMSGGLIVVVLSVNRFFVSWWVGAEQYGGWGLSIGFVAMMLMRHWNVATTYTLFCFGYERQLSLTSLADGLVTVVCAALGIWAWGPMGAPLGSIAGVVLVALPANTRAVAREMGITVPELLRSIVPLVLRIIVVAIIAAVASLWGFDKSLFGAGLLLAVVGTLYGALILPLAINGPAAAYLYRIVPWLGRLTAKRTGKQAAVAGP